MQPANFFFELFVLFPLRLNTGLIIVVPAAEISFSDLNLIASDGKDMIDTSVQKSSVVRHQQKSLLSP